jgi:enoyl-CoA hydratase/carnithine racemase
MPSDKINLRENGDVATLMFNRPERDNAVDAEMMDALVDAIWRARTARILFVTGAGPHFCGGRDPGPVAPAGAAQWAAVLEQIVRTNRALAEFPGVSIALVHGTAHGFGFGVAVQCDITIAAAGARFGFPEIKAGFPPTIVMSYLSRWTCRKKAFELVVTGEEIDAAEAESLGLVNRVIPDQELAAEGDRWAQRLLSLDEEALRACKAFFRDTAHLHPDDAYRYGVSFLANFNSSKKT